MALKLIICFGILILAIAAAFSLLTRPHELWSLSSPNKKYSVQITEKRAFPFIDSESVHLSASSGDETLLKEKLLYAGDFMDDDFIERYPNFSWLSESVLKIGRFQERQADKIIVSNGTSRIKYLLIETYRQKFIVLHVRPGQSIDLIFRYAGRLSVQGEFSTGECFADAVELADKDDYRDGKLFSINVSDGKVEINNPNEKLKNVTCCAGDRSRHDRE